MKIRFAEASLKELDGLQVDALALFVGAERPLRGLPGFADWRLCGALSRVIRAGHFEGKLGEALLLPSSGRLPAPRVFCFGVGEGPLATPLFRQVADQACEALSRAKSEAFACHLPHHEAGEGSEAAARAWLEASERFTGRSQVVLGDARALHKAFAAVKSGKVELEAPPTRVELPARPALARAGA